MKVSSVGPARGGATRRADRKADGKGEFRIDAAAPQSAPTSVHGPGELQSVSALLSLQEVPDATDERSRGLAHGRDLLEELERIRLGLLSGRIERARLLRLTRLVKQRPEAFQDPRLAAVLREIEVRAAVELAKLERAEAAAQPGRPS